MRPSATAISGAAIALSLSAVASPVAAADAVEVCAEASEQGQVLRDRGELGRARELLVTCAAKSCPGVIRKDCGEWLIDVDRKMPSIVVRARDGQGKDQVSVRVLVDGKELAASLDGRALLIDPGKHKLRFEQDGVPPVEQSILVREGEKNRTVDVVLGAPSPAAPEQPLPPAKSGSSIPVASWILAGAAAVGGAGFIYFGLSAKNEVTEMRTTCAPICDPTRVDAARRDALIANVSLGAGIAALGVAVILVIIDQPSSRTPPPKSASFTAPLLHAGITPIPSGGSLIVGGRF